MLEQEVPNTVNFRALNYKALSLCFFPPTQESQSLLNVLDVFLDSDGSLNQDAKSTETPFELAKLEYEYNRLFVGPGCLKCPPYESVHRKDRSEFELGLVLGPSTNDVKKQYQESGLDISKSFRDLPDHITVELEFMYYLCLKEMKAIDDHEAKVWRERQRRFVHSHLSPWAETFANLVLASSSSPLYRSGAKLLKEFIDEEVRFLEARESS
ncbi:MAG: molecular chaperone TorD family protein [Nitrososphaerota archaeon]|nr:molecular chaperone TorD family protein [Nitrososphaerota archaeon]